MRAHSADLSDALLAGGGVIGRRQHPELASVIDWQLRTGALRRVLPGVYAEPGATGTAVDLLAAGLWQPDAVLTGAAAAKLTFWPEVRLNRIDLSDPRRQPETRGRYRLHRRQVPVDLIRQCGPLRVTDPALTALDLCDELDGDGIDTVLRTRTASLAGLWRAMTCTDHRPGNKKRRMLLLDSCSEPWSAAERLQHRLLRAADITGWRANHPVLIEGRRYYLDVAFPERRLAIEIDGRSAHGIGQFEADRWRQNDLVLAGWTVLRFTWAMLVDDADEVIRQVQAVLARPT